MHVVFCSSEITPFAKTGGMADVCGALPLALEELGITVSLFMPEYLSVTENRFALETVTEGLSRTTMGRDIRVYFIRHDDFFKRPYLYGDAQGDYHDNLRRFDFFCRRVLSFVRQLDLRADILHCHDWQTALIPVWMRHRLRRDPFFQNMTTILTIHNLAYQGVFPADQFEFLELGDELLNDKLFEFYGKINFLKAGIVTADKITTVSPHYADEIMTEQFGCGLAGVLNDRRKDVEGILNGIDVGYWNPQTDPMITVNYSAEDVAAKQGNKEYLQRQAGLPVEAHVPVFGCVGRLSHQKGIDLLAEVIPTMAERDWQLVILGNGEEKYERQLKKLAHAFPDKMALFLEFNEGLAHQVYAGSDFFLMPSNYEPCGLSQMISLRYGVIPIVFQTGGLADTIHPFQAGGNGIVFSKYTTEHLRAALTTALDLYRDSRQYGQLVMRAFGHDFSWDKSARAYRALYQQCLSAVP